MFTIMSHWGNANQNHFIMGYHFIPTIMVIIKKRWIITNVGENVEKLEPLIHYWWECKVMQLLWKKFGTSSRS